MGDEITFPFPMFFNRSCLGMDKYFHDTVYSRHRSKKYQSSASLAFVRWTHWWAVNSPHKGLVRRKMFPFDDVIMVCVNHPVFFCNFYSHWQNQLIGLIMLSWLLILLKVRNKITQLTDFIIIWQYWKICTWSNRTGGSDSFVLFQHWTNDSWTLL